MKSNKTLTTGWSQAVKLCQSYCLRPVKVDSLLNKSQANITSDERRRCQFLFLGVVRNLRQIDHIIGELSTKKPRPKLASVLQVAIFEMMSKSLDEAPKIVDFCVNQAKATLSQGEAKFVNAVLRKVPERLKVHAESDSLGVKWSHPDWLVKHWVKAHGEQKTEALLKWNLKAAPVYLRWLAGEEPLPASFEKTAWTDFYELGNADWVEIQPLLDSGKGYIQDASTRLPTDLLAATPGEAILDLCAAPGGKSMSIANALGDDEKGLLVALDRPGPRLSQLDANLQKLSNDAGPEIQLVNKSLFDVTVEDLGQYYGVLLDAPCSNTGVIQRRPDVKWRLTPDSITEMGDLQLRLLEKASEFVLDGGRLVYSTCSIEAEENIDVVNTFLSNHPEFKLVDQHMSYPWAAQHDGGGAFLLKKE